MPLETRARTSKRRLPLLTMGLFIGLAAAVAALSMLTLLGASKALDYLDPEALEFAVGNGGVM